jgi:hypothetical protein
MIEHKELAKRYNELLTDNQRRILGERNAGKTEAEVIANFCDYLMLSVCDPDTLGQIEVSGDIMACTTEVSYNLRVLNFNFRELSKIKMNEFIEAGGNQVRMEKFISGLNDLHNISGLLNSDKHVLGKLRNLFLDFSIVKLPLYINLSVENIEVRSGILLGDKPKRAYKILGSVPQVRIKPEELSFEKYVMTIPYHHLLGRVHPMIYKGGILFYEEVRRVFASTKDSGDYWFKMFKKARAYGYQKNYAHLRELVLEINPVTKAD